MLLVLGQYVTVEVVAIAVSTVLRTVLLVKLYDTSRVVVKIIAGNARRSGPVGSEQCQPFYRFHRNDFRVDIVFRHDPFYRSEEVQRIIHVFFPSDYNFIFVRLSCRLSGERNDPSAGIDFLPFGRRLQYHVFSDTRIAVITKADQLRIGRPIQSIRFAVIEQSLQLGAASRIDDLGLSGKAGQPVVPVQYPLVRKTLHSVLRHDRIISPIVDVIVFVAARELT